MGNGNFGASRSNGTRRHNGLDISGYIGEPIVASKSGIIETGEVSRGIGKYVKISHFDGYVTVYGHLSSISVKDKSWIWQAQKIGEIGKTGNSRYPQIEPHLHFEIRKNRIAQDPMRYLTEKSR